MMSSKSSKVCASSARTARSMYGLPLNTGMPMLTRGGVWCFIAVVWLLPARTPASVTNDSIPPTPITSAPEPSGTRPDVPLPVAALARGVAMPLCQEHNRPVPAKSRDCSGDGITHARLPTQGPEATRRRCASPPRGNADAAAESKTGTYQTLPPMQPISFYLREQSYKFIARGQALAPGERVGHALRSGAPKARRAGPVRADSAARCCKHAYRAILMLLHLTEKATASRDEA